MVSRYKKGIFVFFFLFSIILQIYSQEDTTTDSISDVNTEIEDIESQEAQVPEYSTLDEEAFVLAPESTDITQVRPLGLWSTIRIFLVLAVLLIGVIGFVYLLKRVQTSYNSSKQEVIDIVASRGGAHGSAFHVIKIGTGYVFVGVSNGSINLIKDFTEKEDIDEINLSISKAEEQENKKTHRNNFFNKLKNKFIHANDKALMRGYSESSVLSLFKSRSDTI